MAIHPGRMVEVTRAPALVVELWSGLLTVLNVSGIGKIRYESPHKKWKKHSKDVFNSQGHSHDNGQEGRRTEKGQTRFLHTPTGVKQGATTSFPFVFTSHRSRPCTECDPPKHLPHTKPPAQRRPLTSTLYPQTTVHRHSPREPHASLNCTRAPQRAFLAWRRARSPTSCRVGKSGAVG